MTINTTHGPIPDPHHHPTHTVNTSRVVEEDMHYLDEAPEILAVVPAGGWYALMKDGTLIPLLVFVVTDEGEMYGTILTEHGLIDLSENVEKHDGFVRYTRWICTVHKQNKGAEPMNAKQTIFEIEQEKAAQEARLYSDAFDLGVSAGAVVAQEQFSAVEGTLGPAEARKVRAAEMANVATQLRNELLDKVVEINLKFDEAKVRRQEALESALDPQDVSTAELLQAATADEEQLTSLTDLAFSVGNDDAVLLALRAAPDLNEIASELDFIEELPSFSEDDIAARFETTAPAAPSREELLRTLAT